MIIIIGAGIAGLSLGYELVKRGVEVSILEAATVASGASGVATSYLEPRLGNTAMRVIERESMKRWEHHAAELETQSGIDVEFHREGQIKVALADDAAKLEKDLKAREVQNVPFERLSGADILQREPALSPDIIGGAYLREVRWVTGKKVCEALAKCIANSGGRILEHTPVAHISCDESGTTVRTSNNEVISAKAVVLCNGMGSNSISGLPDDVPDNRVVRGVNLVLDQSLLPQPITHLIKHHRGNMCPRDGSRLIVGTTYEAGVTSLEVNANTVEFLYQNAEPILPDIRQLPLIEVTAGLRSKVGDGNLRLGRSGDQPRIYYSLSHGGAGFLRAPVVADELAEFILSGNKGELTQHHTAG